MVKRTQYTLNFIKKYSPFIVTDITNNIKIDIELEIEPDLPVSKKKIPAEVKRSKCVLYEDSLCPFPDGQK